LPALISAPVLAKGSLRRLPFVRLSTTILIPSGVV